MFDKLVKIVKSLTILSLFSLTACASKVIVTGDIPTPLVPKLPLQAEMIYTDEFKRFNYEEEEKGRGLRSIAFGEAQVALFDTIFSGLLNVVDSEFEGQAVDLRITPSLLDFQYSAPRETKQKIFEIFLVYRVLITDSSEKEIADWVVKGYGKTPTALLTSSDSAFNLATNLALRDVGAQLAIGFKTQPEIKEFLASNLNSNVSQSSLSDAEGVAIEVRE